MKKRTRGFQEKFREGEEEEIAELRLALGLPPLPVVKQRKCLRCRREFKSKVTRICTKCKEYTNHHQLVSSLSGYDTLYSGE